MIKIAESNHEPPTSTTGIYNCISKLEKKNTYSTHGILIADLNHEPQPSLYTMNTY